MKSTQEFLDRFNRWKNGAPILELYKAGRPVTFDDGKDVNKELEEDPALRASLEYALALKLDRYNEGKDTEEPKAVAGEYNFNAIEKVSQNAPLSYGSYYDLTGDVLMDNRLPKYTTGKPSSKADVFVEQLSPMLYREILRRGINNPDRVHDYMMRQLAWESSYGTSNVAKKQHNYGGVGWNGKTYFTYDNDEAFIKDYVRLMAKRYGKALAADTIYGYGAALKEKGYYEDTLEHYTQNLANMKSLSQAVRRHRKTNADLYQVTPPTAAQESLVTQPIILNLEKLSLFTPQPIVLPPTLLTPQEAAYNPDVPKYINKDAGTATWPRYTVLPDIFSVYNSMWGDGSLPLKKPW